MFDLRPMIVKTQQNRFSGYRHVKVSAADKNEKCCRGLSVGAGARFPRLKCSGSEAP